MENSKEEFEILSTNTNLEVVDFLKQKLKEYIDKQELKENKVYLQLIDLLYDNQTSGELIDKKITTLVSKIDERFFGYSVYYKEFNSDFLLELFTKNGIKEIHKKND